MLLADHFTVLFLLPNSLFYIRIMGRGSLRRTFAIF